MKLSYLTFTVLLLASTSLSAATISKDATKIPDMTKILKEFKAEELPDPQMALVNDALYAATDYHNAVNFVRTKYEGTQGWLRGVEDLAHMESLKKEDDACNTNLLSQFFSDSGTVWTKMIDWGFAEEKATAGKNIRKPTNVQLDESGMMTIYENNRWEIGYDALMSLYKNPSKWGKQKEKFPLWNDQKYVYDLYWAKKYGDMYMAVKDRCQITTESESTGTVMACANIAGLSKGPSLKNKEDRYSQEKSARDNVLRAHKAYVTQIQAALAGYSNYNSEFANYKLDFNEPDMPPTALPPFKEILFSTGWVQPPTTRNENIASAHLTFYPEIPEPWRIILELQYPSYYPQTAGKYFAAFPVEGNSEIKQVMAATYRDIYNTGLKDSQEDAKVYQEIFDPTGKKSLKRAASLRPDDTKLPFILTRVAHAMDIRTQIEDLKETYGQNPDGTATQSEKTSNVRFKKDMADLGFTLSDDFDITKKADQENLVSQMKSVEAESIKAVNQMLPELKKNKKLRETHKTKIKTVEKLVSAFKKDSENTAFLSLQNADQVDQLMKQALADKEAQEEYRKYLETRNADKKLRCPIR